MLTDIKDSSNLGTPKYFHELFNAIKNSTSIWQIKDLSKLFYNKNVDGRTIFDGCVDLAFKLKLLILDINGNVVLDNKLAASLNSEIEMKNVFIESLFSSLSNDSDFHTIFSAKYISYDTEYRLKQIDNGAFPFEYSSFKQLLIDFNILQAHPISRIKKYILNPEYKNYFDKDILPEIKRRKKQISLEDLKKALEQKQQHGEEAERYVFQFEKRRLNNKEGIDWVAEYSVSDGFDIASFNSKDSVVLDRFIEVKSYSKDKPHFYWSRNEIDCARIKGNDYYLYLVDRSRILLSNYEPLIISNPYKHFHENANWEKQIDGYEVTIND